MKFKPNPLQAALVQAATEWLYEEVLRTTTFREMAPKGGWFDHTKIYKRLREGSETYSQTQNQTIPFETILRVMYALEIKSFTASFTHNDVTQSVTLAWSGSSLEDVEPMELTAKKWVAEKGETIAQFGQFKSKHNWLRTLWNHHFPLYFILEVMEKRGHKSISIKHSPTNFFTLVWDRPLK